MTAKHARPISGTGGTSRRSAGEAGGPTAVPASRYTYAQLAEIYNQARVDYIVPMPMNARRMQEYVENYDIDMDGSVVVLNSAGLECGIGMLGMRADRAWVTRLGVLPERRERHLGQFMMETMLSYAVDQGARLAQLEVIVGNDPARHLFEKMGFKETRTLLIIRRPPGTPAVGLAQEADTVRQLTDDEIPDYLMRRDPGASWVEETASLLNAGNLHGLEIMAADGENAWVVFQKSPFQLTHLVLSPNASDAAICSALYHVHKSHPMQDTKVENVPLRHHEWEIYQGMGYIEVFRRTEMFLHF
ncbi:MAG: GNAT family N-acetyltransferase [Chloroflexota bacterium]